MIGRQVSILVMKKGYGSILRQMAAKVTKILQC